MLELATLTASVLPRDPTPYVALAMAGFALGILGHLAGARWLVATGIVLIGLGALLLPLALNVTESAPPELERLR